MVTWLKDFASVAIPVTLLGSITLGTVAVVVLSIIDLLGA